MRFGPVVFILSLLALLTTAFPVLAVTYGQLQGKIDFKDGLGVAATPFTIVIGTETRKMISDAQGEFSAVLPTGKAIIKIDNFQQSVLITEGEVTAVKLVVSRPGWVVRCVDAQGNPFNVVYGSARYSLPPVKNSSAGGWKQSGGVKIADDILWFAKMPKNIRELKLLYTVLENGLYKTEHQQWNFPTPPASHQLTATGSPRAQFWLFMEDGNGNRLTNAMVSGKLKFYWEIHQKFSFFDDPTKVQLDLQQYQLVDLQTDGRGAIFLGRWPAGKFVVTLQADGRSGLPITYTLQANGAVGDGNAEGKTYHAHLFTRTVTQTVYSPTNVVQPHVLVYATYCHERRAIYLQQQADDKGKVIWRDLPPVPVITWGEGLAAAVIPVEGDDFRQPLPAPQKQGNIKLLFSAHNKYKSKSLIGSEKGDNFYVELSSDLEEDETVANLIKDDEVVVGSGQASAGTSVSLFVMTLKSPQSYSYISNCYIPYPVDEESVVFRLDFSQFMQLHVKLQLNDGTAVTAISKFSISVEEPLANPLLDIKQKLQRMNVNFPNRYRDTYNLFFPRLATDGSFDICVLGAGMYRLNVDLFDETTPHDQAILFQVNEGDKELAISLPPPIFELPGGCEVNWLTRHAPVSVRSLYVSALADSVPVFAPRGEILACWARPSYNRLHIWDKVTGNERESNLQLRSATLEITNVSSYFSDPGHISLQLLPDLQSGNIYPPDDDSYFDELYYQQNNKEADASEPKAKIKLMTGAATQQFNLWSGRYLLNGSEIQGELLIPPAAEDGRVAIQLPQHTTELDYPQRKLHQYLLKLPDIDKKELGDRTIASSANYICNGTKCDNRTSNKLHSGINFLNLPFDAETISIQWPGWGIISNLSLEKTEITRGKPILQPKEWTPGITIAGKIIDRSGNPYKNGNLSLFLLNSYSDDKYFNFSTDQFGKFVITGLLPNQQIILWDGMASWRLTVSGDNVTDLILHREEFPMRIDIPHADQNSQIWWFPDNGEAQQLFSIGGKISRYDLEPGTGWLWQTDNLKGDGVYQYGRLKTYNNINNQPSRTSLGIYFPYNAGPPLPGEVTVTGMEERAGIYASYPAAKWVKSAQLGLLAGQISALPPGKYRISVQTTYGVVESTVSIGEYGAELHLQFPTKVDIPATPTTVFEEDEYVYEDEN